jgi:amino acid adenylation domain-containing protein
VSAPQKPLEELSRQELDELIRQLQEQGPAARPDAGLPRERPAGGSPVSFAQRRLWFLDQLDPGSPVYNIAGAIDLAGPLHGAALAQALDEIVQRHEALRTAFAAAGGEPVQIAGPRFSLAPPVADLASLPPMARELEAERLAAAAARGPFDLSRPPLVRALLLRLSAQEHTLLVTLHHTVADGWSLGVFLRDLVALYGAACAGQPSPLVPLALQFADFAAREREELQGEALERLLAYWRRRLAALPPPLALPADRLRPAQASRQSAHGGRVPVALPAALSREAEAFARHRGALPFMALLAALDALLCRYSGQEDLIVGSAAANRERVETEDLIGFFVNTLALRGDLSGDPTADQLLDRVRRDTLEDWAHQELPFDLLVQDLHYPGDLFRVMLVVQPQALAALGAAGLTLRPRSLDTGTAKFDLTVDLAADSGGFAGSVEYSADLFEAATAARLAGHLQTLLAGMVENSERRLSELPLLTPAEAEQLRLWHGAALEEMEERCLHELFAAQATRTPEAVAVIAGGARLTYSELNAQANRLAHRLRQLGVGPETRVGISLERGPDTVPALLGILKAGGAYVALDPAYPEERRTFILRDSKAALLLSGAWLDRERQAIARCSGHDPQGGAGAGNLAYAIYTSGSTGVPKGVGIAHRNAASLLRWAAAEFSPEELSGVLASTSLSFDLSVFELFAPLTQGGTVILADSALALPRLPAAGTVTLISTVPSLMAELVRSGGVPASVRVLNLAGEPLRRRLVQRIEESLPAARVLNLYGPSEDTTYSTCEVVPPGVDEEPAIGRPLPGTRAYVLDRHFAQVPLGVTGELYLGGAGLARGYLDQPALTAGRFLPDPFAARPGERLYATGDLVRRLSDGRLAYLGRRDHQVKVHGLRIELGEIETLLERHPNVREAVVVARDEEGDRRLVAYLVPREPAVVAAATPEELREFLGRTLPQPMIPTVFIPLPELPRHPNGKLDRAALPVPGGGAVAGAAALPRSRDEERMARLWAEVLERDGETIGANDSFFALGGHSLLATRLLSRVREELGVELTLRGFFAAPTVAGLARQLMDARQSLTPPILPVARQGDPPLSFAQERLWFLDRLEPGGSTYNLAAAQGLRGRLLPAVLEAALNEVVRRHEALRTTFVLVDGQPRQRIAPALYVGLPRLDLRALPPEVREATARRLAGDWAARPFDLAADPLVRAALLCLGGEGAEEHAILISMHHIVTDGWSLRVLVLELTRLYAAGAAGRPSPLPELPIQYADFALWQRRWLSGEALAGQLAYWRHQLAGAAGLELPVDRPAPAVRSPRGAALPLALPRELARGLLALANRTGTTLFMAVLAGFTALLSRYSGQEDVVVGSPVANRNRAETEGLIGFFVNTLALRAGLSGDPTGRELLARVREVALGAYDHQDLPFEKLIAELQPAESEESRPSLVRVLLTVETDPAAALELPGSTAEPWPLPSRTAKFDLTLDLSASDGRLDGVLEYSTDLFDAATVARLAGHLQALLTALAADPERRLSELPLVLTQAERDQLAARERRSRAALPASGCAAAAGPAFALPRTGDEERLARLWAEVLEVESVGVRDSFFTLGGHSLLATRLLSRVREDFGVEPTLRDFFAAPTVAGLARQLQHARRSLTPPILPTPRQGDPLLSFAQERLWFLDRLEPGGATYNIAAAQVLRGPLRPAVLAAALDEVVRRHEALRTTFPIVGGQPRQRIAPQLQVDLPLIDLQALPPAGREPEARRLAAEWSERPFALEAGPLLRMALLRLNDGENALLTAMHHIVTDGWSLGVLGRELSSLYAAGTAGQPSPLPELPIQYADFALWQRRWLTGEVLDEQLSYWRHQLGGAPALELPSDRPVPRARSPRGASLPLSLASRGLQELANREGATLFMAVLAGFTALLCRYSGQEDVVVGSPVANRNRRETEELVGFFVNTLALRIDLAGEPTGRRLLARVREAALDAYAHQDLPFEKLAAELPPLRAVLALETDAAATLELPGLAAEPWPLASRTAKFDLTLDLSALDGTLAGVAEYSTDLFEGATVARLAGHLQALLSGMALDPERPLSELPLLTPVERVQLMEWSGAAAPYPRERTVHELFAGQAAARPEAVAVSLGEERLTYGELDRRANRLAHRLLRLGAGPEVPVALYLDRSLDMAVALVAVLKTGGAYVPLDPGFPRQRLAFILAQTGALLVLTREPLRADLPADARWLCLDAEDFSAESAGAPPAAGGPDNLAYVMYTSGSTGEPKGVAVTHRAIVRLVRDTRYASFGPEEVFLQAAPLAFDASTFEIWGPLLNGGRLALLPPGPVALEELGEAVARQGVTTLWLTAGLFHAMVEGPIAGLRHLRQLLAGGDVLSPSHVRRALADLPGCVLINGYGPTENTTFTCCHRMVRPEEAGTPVPIGRPIANTWAHVVDRAGQPSPAGAPGELWAGGDGLARGYFGRPGLTAERFVPDPFGAPGGRLYRTGDLARHLPDGTLEFLGRIDQQVKIRGFRIEPGEIEAALAAHPGLEAVAVVPRDAAPGDRRLVAYVVPRPGWVLAFDELLGLAAERLPAYMVPAAFVALAALPLTANGKVDRRALPAPDWAADWAGRETAPSAAGPRNTTEELLVRLWAELLGREPGQVAVDDDFFALGGHSLLATRLISRIREDLRVELPLRSLFEAPTPAGFARLVVASREGPEAPPIRPVPRTGPLPLSFAQERLWFLDQLEPGGAAYHIAAAERLCGPLDTPALAAGLGEIVRRHEALRTTFAVEGGSPVQRIAPLRRGSPALLPVIDLRRLPPEPRRLAAKGLAAAESERSFDLARGPLLRTALLRLAGDEHWLLLTLHHVVADGWSMDIFIRELSALYAAFAAGRPSPLPELAVQYADVAVWQRQRFSGEALAGQLAYWRRQLGGAAVLDLPTDRPAPAVREGQGATLPFSLSPELKDALEALASRERGTLFMALLAGFQALLSRWAAQDDVAVGTAIANRNRAETEGLIGFFVNTLVLRTDLSGDPDTGELLRRAREVSLDAYAHQDLPFEKLVAELAPDRDLSRPPLFRVLLVLMNASLPAPALPGIDAEPLPVDSRAAKFDLTLSLVPAGAGLDGWLEYSTELFDAVTARRLLAHLERLLAGLAAPEAREARLASLPLLAPAERQQMLAEWNDTGAAPPDAADDRCLHELFAAQAAATPEAVAVVCGAQRLTYGELEARANRLAGHLRSLGAGPETPVGVCLERGPELLPALLGILKAGAAYVPLDPAYPQERLAFILEDSRAAVLVTQGSLAERLPALGVRVLVDEVIDEIAGDAAPPEVPPGAGRADHLAYLIYTSGSTGRPKGVAITHRSATALLRWAAGEFPAADLAGVLAATSICFDLSVFELFLPLGRGGTVLLAADALALAGLPAAAEVTLINTVPSAIAELVRLGPPPPGLRTVNLAGEPLQGALVREVERWCPGVRVLNLYGPSEDTTYSTWARADGDERPPAIGRPVAGSRAYLLDRHLGLVATGSPGELHLGGAGLARGYLGRPELTAERFIPDPFAAVPGERLYATGDLARFRPGGELEFLGRRDHQVKIRGFRIELGEIEAALAGHPAVRQAAVLVQDADEGKRLVAYLALDGPADSAGIRAHLQRRLPAHMVPGALVVLDALPLSPNGKVDRRALSAISAPAALSGQAYAAPRNPLEEMTAEILAAVLGVARVGVDDDFFALGGHSLLATRLVSQIRAVLGVELPVRQIFETPTAAALAPAIERRRGAAGPGGDAEPPIVPMPRTEPLPLSFSQERLWFLDKLQPGSAAFNMPVAVRLRGALDPSLLAHSLSASVQRHESLRTTFGAAHGQPFQRIHEELRVPLPLVDLSGLAQPARDAELRRRIAAEAGAPFDLERGPLLRARLFRCAAGDWALLVNLHHIVADGWSLQVLIRELGRSYAAFAAGEPSPLPPLAVQYADFAAWQRRRLQGEVLERHLGYWRRQLSGVLPVLDLPTDRVRPPVQTFHGASRSALLPPQLAADLRALGRSQGATLFMSLFAAFNLLLQRYSGQDDLLIGIPIAGRNRAQIEDQIGFFVNSLVLRTDLSGQPAFGELLARVRHVALDAYTHQDLPFEQLLQELRPERDLSRTPLFQVFFNFQSLADSSLAIPGLTVENLSSPEDFSKFDLTLYVMEEGDGGIRLDLVYNTVLFTAARSREMLAQLELLLIQVAAQPDAPIDSYSLLTPEARRLLPDPAAELDASWIGPVHQHLSSWAVREPSRLAVTDAGGSWSYGELEAQSNRLAHRLAAGGIGRQEVVAIYAHRSATLVWAVLGVLKAGAAFVVLDPAYPAARIIETLRLAQPRAWLEMTAAGAVPEPLAGFVTELPGCLCLALPPWTECTGGGPVAGQPATDPGVPVGPDDLAYIAFTSGSTGAPKGILGRHGPLSHFLPWQQRELGLTGEDRFSLLSGLGHDPLQRDLFTPLYLGAAICVPDPAEIAVPGRLSAWMRRQAVSVAHLTPAMGQLLTESGAGAAEALTALRYVFLVGDVLTRRDVARLRRLAPGVACVNLYGSTETQRAVGYHVVDAAEAADAAPGAGEPSGKEVLPLGRGMQDVQLLVLSRAGQMAGIGEVGEISMRSPHLARGYLGDASGTADRFLANPFTARAGDRLYRTGDLGRYLPDGEVAFAGRADTQVKIRGFRIELGEIQAQLGRLPGVREAVVLATDEDGAGRRLVAYAVLEPAAAPPPSTAELRAHLKAALPAYMVPSAFVLLPRMLLTPNGKIDRRALLALATAQPASDAAYRAPQTRAEVVIAGILREVLGVERVGAEDNFFDLGGNSLLLVQVQSRLQAAFEREVAVLDLFSNPTVGALARHLAPPAVPEPSAGGAAGDDAEKLKAGRDRLRRRFKQNQDTAANPPRRSP